MPTINDPILLSRSSQSPLTLKLIHYFRFYRQSKDGATIFEDRTRRRGILLLDYI